MNYIDYKEYRDVVLSNISFENKKWKTFEKLRNHSFYSIVYKNSDNVLVSAEVLINIKNVAIDELTYSIVFDYNGKTIVERNISRIILCTKDNDSNMFRPVSAYSNVFSEEELESSYMLFYRNNDSNRDGFYHYDISVYHNMSLIHRIENCLDIFPYNYMIGSLVDVLHLHFDRTVIKRKKVIKERYVLMDGTLEIHEEDSNFSLFDWSRIFNNYTNSICNIANYYCSSNPVDVHDILWNSSEKVSWKCCMGHRWKEKVDSITKNKDMDNPCPVCRRCYPGLKPSINVMQTNNMIYLINFISNHLNISDCSSFCHIVESELDVCKNSISVVGSDAYKTWLDNSAYPSVLKRQFSYPSGKDGDIRMYNYKSIGKVIKIDDYVYEVEVPISNKDDFVIAEYDLLFGLFPPDYYDYDNNIAFIQSFLFDNNLLFRFLYMRQAYEMIVLGRAVTSVEKDYSLPFSVFREKTYSECVSAGQNSSKWVNEAYLYRCVKKYYPDAIFQYNASWLGLQSLDIFIPSKNVGIEYQGEQHYRPIDFFGGDEGYKKRQELDKRKRELCKKNNVLLVEWKYTDAINEISVKQVLDSYL